MSPLTIPYLQQLCAVARLYLGDSAIIGGGAPRDIQSKVPVKDIDIFVRIHSEESDAFKRFQRSCESFASVIGGALTFSACPDYPDCFDLAEIHSVSEGVPIQVVGLYVDPVDDVATYDFDLSQVFVTPRGLFETPAAQLARVYQVCTYVAKNAPLDKMKRSLARLERMKSKYPTPWVFSGEAELRAGIAAAEFHL